MNPIVRNILAVLAGIIVGSIVNMVIVNIGGYVIPAPEGAETTTMEGIQASMHLFQPMHYIMPFLAHAVGTLVGAVVAGMIAVNHKMKFAIGIGAFFLIGGATMVYMLPSPMWFNVVDLVGAYIPMGYLGGLIALRQVKE